MCLAQGPQRSDAGEARTRGLSVSNNPNLKSHSVPIPSIMSAHFLEPMFVLESKREEKNKS